MPKKKKSASRSFGAQLSALPDEARLRDPAIPATAMLFEARRLAGAAKKARATFAKLPDFDVDHIDGLAALIGFAEACERAWEQQRFAKAAGAGRVKARKEAESLRGDILDAGEYLFRKQVAALAEIGRIREGEGLADLVQDLHDLGAHRDANAKTWALDTTLPKGAFKRIGDLCTQLESVDESEDAVSAHEQRNRAFVLLAASLTEIREAAAYVLRKRPASLKPFRSDYLANKMRRSRQKKAKAKVDDT